MTTTYFDQDSDGLVARTEDSGPTHRLALIEHDGQMIVRVEVDGKTIDSYLTDQQLSAFTKSCCAIAQRLGVKFE